MKLGAQLYTVRKMMTTPEEIEKGLERIAQIGYSCVQISAIGKIAPEKIKGICDRLGLEIALTHTHPDRILGDTDNVIREHDIMDCKYIGLGAMPAYYRSMSGTDDFYNNFHTAIEKINAKGKVFTYHNHAFEFERFNGELLLDRLLSHFTPEEFMVTLDCYWVNYSGSDVCDVIDRLAGRIDCVHLKDQGVTDKQILMKPVMEGNMNYPRILTHLEKAGVKYAFVEQDDCYGEDPFACLETSYNNLKKYF